VAERREDLPFLPEPADDPRVEVRSAAHQLERDLLVEMAVVPVGEEHRAHSALADHPLDPIGPDAVGHRHPRLAGDLRNDRRDLGRGSVEQRGRTFPRLENFQNLGPQGGIVGAFPLKKRAPVGARQVEHRVEQLLDPLPPVRAGGRSAWMTRTTPARQATTGPRRSRMTSTTFTTSTRTTTSACT
jgi:hypothetical protein